MLSLTIIPIAFAHSPINEDGDSLEDALMINDPTKSWALYSELEDHEDVRYYKFEIKKGDNIYVSLFVPPKFQDFRPQFILYGPGLEENISLPNKVETPSGGGAKSLEYYEDPEPSFEPFTPSALIDLGIIDLSAPETGTYYLIIYSEEGETGHFGFALGRRESFTVSEIFMLPIMIFQIYLWEGQFFLFILLPLMLTYLLGGLYIFYYKKTHKGPDSLQDYFLVIGGLTLIGTAANTAYQVIQKGFITGPSIAILFSLFFILVPLYLGYSVIKTGIKTKKSFSKFKRLKFIIFGIIAILMWTGLYIGPFLLFGAALLPFQGKARL